MTTKQLDDNDTLRQHGRSALDPLAGVERARAPAEQRLHDAAPLLADAYTVEELELDQRRELVSLASLPPWPRGPRTGHGWGDVLDKMLGNGVCPPYLLGIGAAAAGAGKTAWVMQLVDGLALRSAALVGGPQQGFFPEPSAPAARGPLTPTFVLSEMDAAALTWRTLARWTSYPASVFRAGGSAPRGTNVQEAFTKAREALRGQLGAARRWQRYYRGEATGDRLLEQLPELVNAWRDQVVAQHPDRDVWPVVVIDPVQRFAGYDKPELEALHELTVALANLAKEHRWVVFLTSDTNKASATGQGRQGADAGRTLAEEGAGAFRGSYVLVHMCDAVLYLRLAEATPDEVELAVIKNRWGPSAANAPDEARVFYRWNRPLLRFEPMPARAPSSPPPPAGPDDIGRSAME